MGKRVMINGREVLVPDVVVTGRELKALGDIPVGRNLVLQRPEGNFLISNDQQVQVLDDDYFSDAPTFEYGAL